MRDKREDIICRFRKGPELLCQNCAWQKGYLDPVDFGGRDIAFLEQAEDASAKGESICVSVSEDSVKRMITLNRLPPWPT